ncbi:MAG: DUF488 domain-containing protein [Deltaproteobacteria bacterium]|nr:DUF488 domain-containing protein [Deltaproteobacteria bacterium]
MCSEENPDICHRRVLADLLKSVDKKISIIHL